jgi:transcription elongation factor
MEIRSPLWVRGNCQACDNAALFGTTVHVVAGRHAGKHGVVVRLVGRKSVEVWMEAWAETSVMWVSSVVEAVVPRDAKPPSKKQRVDVGVVVDEQPEVAMSIATPAIEKGKVAFVGFHVGCAVRFVRGSYRGQRGVVRKIHPKMVTVELVEDDRSVVRVAKTSLVVQEAK